MRKLYSIGLAISCLVASSTGASMVACSSSNTGTGSLPDGGGTGGNDGSGSSTGGGGGGTSTGTGGGGGACESCSCLPPADLLCQSPDAGDCLDCCVLGHQSGVTTFYNSVIQNCCAGCSTACSATLCAANPSPPALLCQNCIDGELDPDSGAYFNCTAPVKAACDDNPDCVAYANCAACCP